MNTSLDWRLEQKVKRNLYLNSFAKLPKIDNVITMWRFIDGREICQKPPLLRWGSSLRGLEGG